MELFLIGHTYQYAVEQIMLTLFPDERPRYPSCSSGADSAVVRLHRAAQWTSATTRLTVGGKTQLGRARVETARLTDALETDRLCQRILKQSFYRAALPFLERKPPWGALGGIRPAKLMRRLLDAGCTDAAAAREFTALYDAAPARTALCLDAAHAAQKAARMLSPQDVCLYVGIPFCPTRCAYCSFVSQSVEKSLHFIEPFLSALSQDIAATAAAVAEAGLRPAALYFGGGTPTTLSAAQLDALFDRLEAAFDLSACREITVEAGRPDTITAEKLAVLRRHGVTRVSVNPQTMRDEVLRAIGRRHTAQEVLDALALVRAAGDFAVNMDLIAGLPQDDTAGFCETLRQCLALAPENLTVHTLSLKKGARILLENTVLPDEAAVAEMLDFAAPALRAAGFAPYYLYRQKFMSGGFENVGWCRQGEENLYNICIMEELCGILSMGAGASTKLVGGGGKLRRFFAPKYPQEYIQGIAKICADKRRIVEFYQGGTP